MSREAAEAVAREALAPIHGATVEGQVRHVIENALDDADPGYIAQDLWALGVGVEHAGCRYGGDEPDDAEYENGCSVCQAHCEALASRIAAEVTEPTDHQNGGEK